MINCRSTCVDRRYDLIFGHETVKLVVAGVKILIDSHHRGKHIIFDLLSMAIARR